MNPRIDTTRKRTLRAYLGLASLCATCISAQAQTAGPSIPADASAQAGAPTLKVNPIDALRNFEPDVNEEYWSWARSKSPESSLSMGRLLCLKRFPGAAWKLDPTKQP